ncbi:Rho guanine nucleotide exchange factor (GEF) 17 [Umbelopsis nana]
MQSGLVVGNRKLEASLTTAKMLDVRNNFLRANTASMLKESSIRTLAQSTSPLDIFVRAKSSANLLDSCFKHPTESKRKPGANQSNKAFDQAIRRCASASILRNMVNNDLSGTMKEFAVLFHKAKVSPARPNVSEKEHSPALHKVPFQFTVDSDDSIESDAFQNNNVTSLDQLNSEPGAYNAFYHRSLSVLLEVESNELVTQGSVESFNSWTDTDFLEENVVIERLNNNFYEQKFYEQEHLIYIGKDKSLGPICIALMENSESSAHEAIVRGQFLSAYIEIYPDDVNDILAEGGVDNLKSNLNSKSLVLLGVLKAYVDFLIRECPTMHGVVKSESQNNKGFEDSKNLESHGSPLVSIQQLKKLVDSGLTCLRSKQDQISADSVSEAVRRLDLAMVRRAHFIDVPVKPSDLMDAQSTLINLLGLERIGVEDYVSYEADRAACLNQHTNKQDPEKRSWIVQELLESERKYLRSLEQLQDNVEEHATSSSEKISVSSLLIEPVQRIPRYTPLIDEILKHTTADHPDRPHLISAKVTANRIAGVHEGKEEITARVINQLISSVKNCPPTLLKNNRRLISHIDAHEIDVLNGKVVRFVTLILFNDILLIVKRVSSSISGKSILPTEASGEVDYCYANSGHSSTNYPDMVAFRNSLSQGSRTPFKFKSCIQLSNMDIFIPKGNEEDHKRLDDIIYIRSAHRAIDDQEYFSSGCLRQYVLGNDSPNGRSFVRLMNEQKAAHSVPDTG